MADLNVLSADTPWEKLFGALHIKMQQTAGKVTKGIAAIGKKIVIIIDDLDRLTGSEILEVLKLITKMPHLRILYLLQLMIKNT